MKNPWIFEFSARKWEHHIFVLCMSIFSKVDRLALIDQSCVDRCADECAVVMIQKDTHVTS